MKGWALGLGPGVRPAGVVPPASASREVESESKRGSDRARERAIDVLKRRLMRMHRVIAATLGLTFLAPSMALAAEEGDPGLFSVNLGLSIWTIVIFLLLLWILSKFAWGPILAGLEAREKNIQGNLDDAAREREEAMKLLESHKQQLAESRREAQQIIADARAAGDDVRREIEEKARSEAQSILASARKEIEREKDMALDSIRQESVDLAMAAASRLIQERLDSEQDRKLVESFLAQATPESQGA